ncbi:MAG: SET domain-containing protein [Planctomycetota bacterium]|nr:MAG: SET domain-containing protein [Planctomycetota bacterium]
MSLSQSEYLEVRRIPGKGRGVFAKIAIPKGTVFETVPVLVCKQDDIIGSNLMDYVYAWTSSSVALALGYGSLYNHSYKPNARYDDLAQQRKSYTALRDIAAGDEITINYNGDPKSRKNVGFDVLE